MINIIGQVFGFVALFFAVLSFQSNKREKILSLQLLSSIFYFLNLLFLGGLTGAYSLLFGVFRNYIYSLKGKKNWASQPIWVIIFIVIFIISGILTYKNMFSILPIIGMCIGTVGLWMTKPSYIRWFAAFGPPLWIVYNYVSHSIGGIILELFYLISITIGIIRFDILKQKEVQN